MLKFKDFLTENCCDDGPCDVPRETIDRSKEILTLEEYKQFVKVF